MKFVLALAIFIMLSIGASASWETYENDLRNSGSSDETGYFPLDTANFSSNTYGMNFQPLVSDLDGNGDNEIIIFSNDSLIIFNPQLGILNQTKVGTILGQPAVFNKSIIFNSRINNSNYFFAYQYNASGLNQKFNITLVNDADFGGIKCIGLNGTNSCIFKDKMNYVHITDLDAETDSYYSVSAYNETIQTVPAIGDIDNDGDTEAVFWLDYNGNNQHGLMAFDLSKKKVKWIADDIFVSLFGIASTNILKGQPVLVDLNNDGKLETAVSVFYDDDLPNLYPYNDWFTELFVYSHNGTKLFSKCEANTILNNRCNDASSVISSWEGTNPFVIDFDKNGADDICFIKDKKIGGYFAYMALNCYNYSGDEIANVRLSNNPQGIRGTAMASDINNDGNKEIIISHDIYLLNGTIIFDMPSLDIFHPIAVDIDGNKGMDLLWTQGSQTKIFLDSNKYKSDLSVSASDITFSKINETHVNVTTIIKNNGQIEADNVRVIIYNTETLENNTASFNIRRGASATFSSILELKKGEKVLVSVDYDDEIDETDETNNFAVKEFVGLPYVYIESRQDEYGILSFLEPVIIDYVKKNLVSGYYTDNELKADVKVYIGKDNPTNKNNNPTMLNNFEFGYDYGSIIYYDRKGLNPYSSIVAGFKTNSLFGSSVKVMIAGNDLEGDIAGVKEFIKNQDLFLNTEDKSSVFIDDENADAIKIYDFLHLGGNFEHYKSFDDEFKKIVSNALNDEMFNVYDKNVVTNNGITLRLRNLKPNLSSDYLEYLNSTGMPVEVPVVLAHGLFSNLTTWETLGAEISNTGRDTWLIEITGGPNQDCDNCIDYTYYNLTDIFVPALLNGVLTFTGKDNLQYVGFSNGCRAALDTLERGQFDSNKIETFVAVGCPGSFEGNSTFGSVIFSKNGEVSRILESIGKNHYTFETIAIASLFNRNYIPKGGSNKISLNLWKFYENIINSSFDTQPGNIQVPNFVIIQGSGLTTDDGIVTVKDEQKIYQNVNNINSKKYFDIFALHSTLDEKDRTKSIIRKSLNKQDLSFYERTINLINQSG